ncbi:hypothetical protein SEPCBS119000_005683 [Sporothrix epigloea]|uniref:F-box domain-containing protein n=1 Tax=Sporothrix epigloea TaxID=1892477 RepID=A0ABP0DYW6_9PEZI
MAGAKRKLQDDDDPGQKDVTGINAGDTDGSASRISDCKSADGLVKKRFKTHEAQKYPNDGAVEHGQIAESKWLAPSSYADFLSPLSDELLVRILGHLTLADLFKLAPVSRRFHRLADDSQLWKAFYYEKYVLPRALRIPGFRGGSLTNTISAYTSCPGPKTYSEQRIFGVQETVPIVGEDCSKGPVTSIFARRPTVDSRVAVDAAANKRAGPKLNWKQQYKLRHNWTRGKCAVEELRLSTGTRRSDKLQASRPQRGEEVAETGDLDSEEAEDGCVDFRRMLVKVVEGIAVTADQKRGLRVWELKPRKLVATGIFKRRTRPTEGDRKTTGVVGVVGELGLDQETESPAPGVPEDKGDAVPTTPTSLAINLSHDNLDIATGLLDGGFDIWQHKLATDSLVRRYSHPASDGGSLTGIAYYHPYVLAATDDGLISLYVFGPASKPPCVKANFNEASTLMLSPPQLLTSLRSHTSRPPLALSIRRLPSVTIASIAYTFATRQGWSIATMPDNTLILHLCTSNDSTLAISPGIRLWGHTSGISDAEITARGKAVSVSVRGEEMRVWELEGRPAAERGLSVAIRPNLGHGKINEERSPDSYWDERRSWVGFDDEMVIVLKEARGGRESLMVYDFS